MPAERSTLTRSFRVNSIKSWSPVRGKPAFLFMFIFAAIDITCLDCSQGWGFMIIPTPLCDLGVLRLLPRRMWLPESGRVHSPSPPPGEIAWIVATRTMRDPISTNVFIKKGNSSWRVPDVAD
jgi:hypothetical protein